MGAIDGLNLLQSKGTRKVCADWIEVPIHFTNRLLRRPVLMERFYVQFSRDPQNSNSMYIKDFRIKDQFLITGMCKGIRRRVPIGLVTHFFRQSAEGINYVLWAAYVQVLYYIWNYNSMYIKDCRIKNQFLIKNLRRLPKLPPWLKYAADNGLKIEKYKDGRYRWYKLVVE